ncbi:MAG: FecR domain-containing protein [Alphaproteobacteria bacterium]|nr:FecR domain-containing protein [Alphaproteobacteria bacterium]
MIRHITLPSIVALLLAFPVGNAALAAQQQAGVAAAVRGQVALTRAAQNIVGKKVKSGESIFLGDTLASGPDSGMQIMLLDETIFTIGPNSEMSIDEFVYDPTTNAGKVVASVTKGVFRFITGKIARKRPEDMTVRLPTATIGIRGTIVAGAVRSDVADPAVERLFKSLRGLAPGAESARDFAVLLGPGSQNNTNDKGGEFIFSSGGSSRAEIGRSAGSSLAQLLGGAGLGDSGVRVSRTGWGAAAGANGQIYGPFTVPVDVTQGLTSPLSTQAPSGPTGKPSDDNAQEANSFDGSTANQESGNFGAEVGAFVSENVVGQLDDEGASEIFDAVDASNPGGGGGVPVSIDAVVGAFSGFNHAEANFAVNQNGIAFNFSMTIHFEDQFIQAQFQNIKAGVHDFGSAFGQVDFADLAGGLAADSGFPDSVSSGSDGDCNACTLSVVMFTVDTATASLKFDNGGASVGGDFNGVTGTGTGAVTGLNLP